MKRKLFMTRIYAARISLLRPPDHSNGLRLIRSSRDGAATASVSSEIHDNARQNFPPLCFSLGKAAAVRNAIEGDTRDSTTSDNSAQSSLYKKPNHVRFEGFIMNNNFSVFSSSPHRSLACALTFGLSSISAFILFYIFSRRSYSSFLPLSIQLQLLGEEIPILKTARGFQYQSLHEKSLIEFVI